MAVIETGLGTAGLLVVDPTTGAARSVAMPTEHADGGTNYGHYSWGGFSGVMAVSLGAATELFQFRWTSGVAIAVIKRVRISVAVSTTLFAASTPMNIDMVKSGTWSAQGTGGTGITPAATLKRRGANMGSTALGAGDMRIATTAGLGAGTKTLEANALAAISAGLQITGSTNLTVIPAATALFDAEEGSGHHPLVLGQNEGFSIINRIALPATGTWGFSVNVDWMENTGY